MNILIINDDGIKAEGLKVLVDVLKPLGNIYIFAPEHHQSGKSQALSLGVNIKVKDYKNLYGSVAAYSCSGTPADCLRLALFLLKDIQFDLVVSGINQGPNIGVSVLHSGTLGAASEAAGFKIPAIAISSPFDSFSMAKKYTYQIVSYLLKENIVKSDYVLNINYPISKFSKPIDIKFTTQGQNKHYPKFKEVKKNTYRSTFGVWDFKESTDSDVYCYLNGIISITPVFEDRSKKEVSKMLNDKTKLNELINYDKIN